MKLCEYCGMPWELPCEDWCPTRRADFVPDSEIEIIRIPEPFAYHPPLTEEECPF